MHGRLLEAVHVSGYSFERACADLEWLLEEDRWRKCGNGFEDIRDFLGTVDLSPFNIESSHRKRLAKRLQELEASQRSTAKVLGVSEATIARDNGKTRGATNVAVEEDNQRKNQDEERENATNVAHPSSMSGRDAAKAVEQTVKKSEKTAKKKTDRAAKEKREKNATATTPVLHICGVGDLKKHVKKSSIDAVITDPPYPKDFLDVYSELGQFCNHSLKPSGVLVCMVGQSYLPEIMALLSEYLTYRWSCAYLTPGGQAVQLWDREVNTFWKPLLVFSKSGAKSGRWIGDVFSSDVNDNDKDHHHWGQSESGMAKIIRAFSEPGEHVCDPFLGGGTTAVVSCEMGREFTGCDIESSCIETTLGRFSQ